MKFILKNTSLTLLTVLLASCNPKSYKIKVKTTQKTTLNKKATIEINEIGDESPDSIHVYVGSKKLNFTKNTPISIATNDLGIGKHHVTALSFFEKKVKKASNYIEVFSNISPTVYTYKIINKYPHDTNSFTQGLEFHNGFLYETTGGKGKSVLRKIAYKTGKVLQETKLDKKYFGEGMTIIDNQIFWLTWQARKGFIYDINTFEQTGEFSYQNSLEGWGLTHNSKDLIKSDGSNKIWFLNTQNEKENNFIQVYTDKVTIDKLNELEYIDGKIYANSWQKPYVVIINPDNGIVEGIINFKKLIASMKQTQNINEEEVLNGIAYNNKTNTFFVTGKRWNTLFEIEIVKQ